MQSDDIIPTVQQYLHRLDDHSSIERVNALQQLQNLSRSVPDLVGQLVIPRIFKFLYEQNNTEECMETLDVIVRLLTRKNNNASIQNVNLVLSTSSNVDLLLDLLEHEDLTVAVMSNEVLNELHNQNGETLERIIQECPDGMNKLLLRLSDNSREEVRNQALVFVKQLTKSNEEMKKTVAFNEGFDILFKIIRIEGSNSDNGPVIQDCLEICKNLLSHSETCQRLFFGMGSEWILEVSNFFNPSILEQEQSDSTIESSMYSSWYQDHNKVKCAQLAIEILVSGLNIVNSKHQNMLAITLQSITPMICHWLVRQGPFSLVESCLQFLTNIIENNQQVASNIINLILTYTSFKKGKNISNDLVGYKYASIISIDDDRRCITIPLLLTECYVFSYLPWGENLLLNIIDKSAMNQSSHLTENIMSSYMSVLEKLLSTDTSYPGMIIQFILAPAISEDDDFSMDNNILFSKKSMGDILVNVVYEFCQDLIETNSLASIKNTGKPTIINFEKACVLLELVFLHGGLLARELVTALTLSHCQSSNNNVPITVGNTSQLLPYLLNCTGRAVRLPNSQVFVTSLLKVLAIVSSECARAIHQMLEDPTNLFPLDLAAPNSDTIGVSINVQILSCLFCGSCLTSLTTEATSSTTEKTKSSIQLLNRQKFISMIDSKIGLTRFMDILKRPINTSATSANSNLRQDLFKSASFEKFYVATVEQVQQCIYDYYTGVGITVDLSGQINKINNNNNNELIEALKTIEIQKTQILDLENYISKLSSSENSNNLLTDNNNNNNNNNNVLTSDEIIYLKSVIIQLENEKSNLKEILSQKDRKLAMMEDELHSNDISFEMNKEKDFKIKELENRNADLLMKCHELELEFNAQHKQQLLNTSVNINHDNINNQHQLNKIKLLITSYTQQLGVPEDFLVCVDNGNTDEYVDSLLDSCRSYISHVSGTINDIAEGLGFRFTKSEEGSIGRLMDCIEQMQHAIGGMKLDMENLMSEYTHKCQDFESEINVLRNMIPESNESEHDIINNDLQKKYQELTIDKSFLTEELLLLKNENISLKSFVDELTRQLKEYESSWHQLKIVNEDLEKKVIQMNQIIEDKSIIQESSSANKDVINQLQDKLSDSEKYSFELENQLAQLKQHIHELQSFEQIHQNNDDDNDNRMKLIESENNRIELEKIIVDMQKSAILVQTENELLLTNLRKEIDSSNNNISDIKKQLDQTQNDNILKNNEITMLQKKLEISEQNCVELENDIAESLRKMEELQNDKYNNKDDSTHSVFDKLVENEHYENKIAELEDKLNTSDSLISQLKTDLEVSQNNNNHNSDIITQLQEQLAVSEQTRVELENVVSESLRNLHELQNENLDKNDVFNKLSETQQRTNELNHKIAELEMLISQQEDKLNTSDSLISQLKTDLEVSQNNNNHNSDIITQLQEQLAVSEQTRVELENVVSESLRNLHELQNENLDKNDVFNKLSETQQRTNELNHKIAELEMLISQQEDKLSTSDSLISQLKTDLEVSQNNNNHNSDIITQLQEQLTVSEQTRVELENVVSESLRNLHELQNENLDKNDVFNKLSETQQRTNELNHKIAELEMLISQQEDKLSTSDSLISQLKTDLEVSQNNNNHNSDIITQLQEQLTISQGKFCELEVILAESDINNKVLTESNIEKEDKISKLTCELKTISNVMNDERMKFEQNSNSDQSKIIELQNHIDELTNKLRQLSSDLVEYKEKSKQEIDKFMTQSQSQIETFNEVNQRALLAEKNIHCLKEELASYSELKHQYEIVSKKLFHYETEISEKNETASELLSQNVSLTNEKAALEASNIELMNKLKTITLNTSNLDETNKNLQAEVIKLHQDLKDIRQYSLNLEQEHEHFKKIMSSENALQTQNNELKRLQLKIDSISQELQIKERELHQVIEQCRRHEGESAGKSITLDSLAVDYENLLTENESLSKKLAAEIRTCKDLKREIENLNISLKMFQNGKFNGSNSEISHLASKPDSKLSTPTKINIDHTITTLTTSAHNKSSNELVLLQSNLAKERHRLHQLQEEHTDLLGLLAQQEIELTVFRKTVEKELGDLIMKLTDDRVKQIVTEKYGSYNEYRIDYETEAVF